MFHLLQIKIWVNGAQESNPFTENHPFMCHFQSDPASSKVSRNGAHVVPKVWHMPLRLLSVSLRQDNGYVSFLSHPSLRLFFSLILNREETLLESHHRYSCTWSSWCANVTRVYVQAQKFANHLSVCIPSSSVFVHTHIHIYICVYIYIHHWHRTAFGSRWGYRYACRWTGIKCYALTIALSHAPMKSYSIRMDLQLQIKFPLKSNCTVVKLKDWYYKMHDI